MAMEYTKHFLSVLATLLLLHSHALLPSTSALAQLLPIVSSRRTQVYIVHVQHPKGCTNHLTAEERDEWYHSFLPNATLDSGEPRMVHTYEVVISGFAARLTPEEAEAMEFRDGFVLAHPEGIHPLHTTYTPKLLGLDQYNSLWKSSNQGEGVIIAVLDSGILATHSSFADTLQLPPPPLKWRGRCDLPPGSGACNNKLIGAQVFVQGKKPTTNDIDGHGTHVAGIAAGSPVYDANVNGLASGTASGTAPRAHLAVYKVCSGRCPDSASLKGMDRAIIDGVDIIQISNGSPNEFHLSANIKGSYRATEMGILTVCAAGNSGPFLSRISNEAPWILTVGAATIDRTNPAVLKLGNGMELEGQSGYHPNPSGALDLPIFYPGAKSQQESVLTCQDGSMAGLNITGKIVICANGFTFPAEKSKVVKAAGGAAIIAVNQKLQGDTLTSNQFVIPGIVISYNDGLKLIDYVSNEPSPTGSITFRDTEFGFRPSPMVGAFSSRGPSLVNGGILKPDVIAPGVDILSAWPFDVGPNQAGVASAAANSDMYNFMVGTSMAAPHVSGIAALLKKTRPDWTPAMIKSAIMTTAYTNDRSGGKIVDALSKSGGPANAFAVGAGHVNPSAAEDPGLVYDTPIKDYIPYMCGLKGMTKVQIVAIAKRPISCAVKIAAEELNYPSISASMGRSGPSKTITRTATNVGAENSIYTVTVVEPKGVKVEVNPKTLQFGGIGDRQSFTVEISLTGSPPTKNDVWEGSLTWVSGNYQVTSPIVVSE